MRRAICLLFSLTTAAAMAQNVRVVDIVPATLSGETNTDSEPNLAVNPANLSQIVATAFTPDPLGSANAPIYVSSDGGQNWLLNAIVPGGNAFSGTGDITVRFATTGNVLYAGDLRGDTAFRMDLLRTSDFLGPALMTVLSNRTPVDQPYIQALTTVQAAVSTDRVYVGNNNISLRGTTGKTASVDLSQDAATAPAPAGFSTVSVETRATSAIPGGNQDGPSVRVAVHPGGTVYAAYFGWRTFARPNISDIVVVRDDNFGASAAPFTALLDPGDGLAGVRVATNVSIPALGTPIGNQRIGSHLTIAVDPSNSQRVFLAWADGTTAANYTLRIRSSVDGGATWSGDLRTITNAVNPSLAVDSGGRVGLLYQRRTGAAGSERWETHLERSSTGFTAPPSGILLHDARDNVGGAVGAGPLGDYSHLLAIGRAFYGIFSANNVPVPANFPHGVRYQRNANTTTNQLLANDGVTNVAASTDPFFFAVTDPVVPPPCLRVGGCKEALQFKELLRFKCDVAGCTITDFIPRNCLVKFPCPGCEGFGLCPPFYEFTFDGLRDDWNIGLFDAKGEPVPHGLYRDGDRTILSFRPDKERFKDKSIGDYTLVFQLAEKGQVGKTYDVKTTLKRSTSPFFRPVGAQKASSESKTKRAP